MNLRTLLFGLMLVPMAAVAQASETLFNLVSLQSQAVREVPNDLLGATLAAEAEGVDPAQLARDVNRAMQAALAIAKSYSQVRARSGAYQTTPIYDKNRITRWRVRQELRLESADFSAATELIGKLQGGTPSSAPSSLVVAGMALSVSPESRRQAENALIMEALASFNERARVVQEAMKAKGYRMQNLSISPGAQPPRPLAMAARAASFDSGSQPAIEPGSSSVFIVVSGTIQLQ